MKTSVCAAIFGLLIAGRVAAQDSAERVVIPARNSTRPRQLNVSLLNGGVTVRAYAGKDVIVETRGSHNGRDRHRGPSEMDGLKRIEFPGNSGLEIEEENNTIDVRERNAQTADLLISVPLETSVKVRCNNGGDITIEGVHGEIDAHNLNGRVTMTGISGTVVAHSLNGGVKVSMDHVDASKPIFFSTLNGEVDVTLPADFKGNLKLKTDNGEIYSDFEIKLDPSRNRASVDPSHSSGGKYRMQSERALYGTVNGGGQEASFTTFNGRISVRRKK